MASGHGAQDRPTKALLEQKGYSVGRVHRVVDKRIVRIRQRSWQVADKRIVRSRQRSWQAADKRLVRSR